MKDGFIRGAAASIDVLVADPKHNCEKILETIQTADARNVTVGCTNHTSGSYSRLIA